MVAGLGLLAVVLGGCGGEEQDFGPTAPVSGSEKVWVSPHAEAEETADSAADSPVDDSDEIPGKSPEDPAESRTAASVTKGGEAAGAKGEGPTVAADDDPPPGTQAETQDDGTAGESTPTGSVLSRLRSRSQASRDDDDDDDDDDDNAPSRPSVSDGEIRPPQWMADRRKTAFSPNGRLLAVIGDNGDVRVFETETGRLVNVIESDGVKTTNVAVSDVAAVIVVADSVGRLRVIEMRDLSRFDAYSLAALRRQQKQTRWYADGESAVTEMRFTRNGQDLVTGNAVGEVRIRSTADRKPDGDDWPARAEISVHSTPVTALVPPGDSGVVFSAALDRTVRAFNIDGGNEVAAAQLESPAVALGIGDTAEATVVVGCLDGAVLGWDYAADDAPHVLESGGRDDDALTGLFFDADSRYLAATLTTGMVSLRDPSTGRVVRSTRGHRGPVVGVVIPEEGGRVMTCGVDGLCRAWLPDDLSVTARAKRTSVDRFRVDAPAAGSDDDDDDDGPRRTSGNGVWRLVRANPNEGKSDETVGLEEMLRTSTGADREKARHAVWGDDAENQLASLKLRREIDRLEEAFDSADASERAELRQQLKDLQAKAGKDPVLVRQIDADFPEIADRLVAVTIDSDAGVAAASVSSTAKTREGEGVLVAWDIPTGVEVRRWSSPVPARSLALVSRGNWLLPIPASLRPRTEPPRRYELPTGLVHDAEADPNCVLRTTAGGALVAYIGQAGRTGVTLEALQAGSATRRAVYDSFETLVPAIALLGQDQVVASIRERSTSRLAIFGADSLTEETVVFQESVDDRWLQENKRATGSLGITSVVTARSGRMMATHGCFDGDDYRFAIWSRRGSKWGTEPLVSQQSTPFLRELASGPAMTFVDGRDGALAGLTKDGLKIVDTRNGRISAAVPVAGNLFAFTPDQRWLVCEQSGRLQFTSLLSPEREPREFTAQKGPVLAMSFSTDGRYLATLGEEGRLNVWRVREWLARSR